MTRDYILEVLNGIWATLSFTLLAWFTYYIWAQVRELEDFVWSQTFKYWWKNGLPAHINAAIAIYVYTIGDFVVRGWMWMYRHLLANGYSETDLSIWPVIIGGVITALGLMCQIRVFTIYRIGNIAWILTGLLILMLLLIAYLTMNVSGAEAMSSCGYIKFLVGPKYSS